MALTEMALTEMFEVKHTFIIAEAGVNHNGSLEMAKRLIEAAAEAGADAVKFQTFQAEKITSRSAPKAAYQVAAAREYESQLEMLKRLELNPEAHQTLVEHCQNCGIQFLSTPFDFESLALLAKELDLPFIKIPSGEVTNAPFLLEAARYGKPIVLSTGMCTLTEVETALGVIAFGYLGGDDPPTKPKFNTAFNSPEGRSLLKERVALLHCTTEYPAPFGEINLRVMDTLSAKFGLSVGLSDHSAGIAVAIAAVARGAAVIEKHFTLDKSLPGPDHQASIEPEELRGMVLSIRQVELALGSREKAPTASELKNRSIVRRSLTAGRDIKAGEVFTPENLVVKRPGSGIDPMEYWEYLGKKANRDYQKDDTMTPSNGNLPVIIIGGGSHAKVLIDLLLLQPVSIIGIADPNMAGYTVLGIPVIGNDDVVFNHPPGEIKLVNGVGSTADLSKRTTVFGFFKSSGYGFATLIHPAAIIGTQVDIGEGVQIMAGAIVQTGSRIGDNTIINTRAVVDHDCSIGNHVHLAPGVTLSGGVMIGEGVHIGTGASVIQNIRIGDNSIIGAGAAIINDVPDNAVVVGVPGKVVKYR